MILDVKTELVELVTEFISYASQLLDSNQITKEEYDNITKTKIEFIEGIIADEQQKAIEC